MDYIILNLLSAPNMKIDIASQCLLFPFFDIFFEMIVRIKNAITLDTDSILVENFSDSQCPLPATPSFYINLRE